MYAKYSELQEANGLNSPEVNIAALKQSSSQAFIETMTPKASQVLTGSYDESVDLMLKRKVDVIIADRPFCALIAYRHRDQGGIAGASPLTFESLGVALPEDTLLINWVENFMGLLKGSGLLKKMRLIAD